MVNFWTDPWLNGGRLKDRYGDRAIYDLCLGVDVIVHQFSVDHNWNFPLPRSYALMDIFQNITKEIQPQYEFDDELVWTLEQEGNFTLKFAYCLVSGNFDQNLQWHRLIWFQGCIKKHSICAWMFFLGKLKKKGVPPSKKCGL